MITFESYMQFRCQCSRIKDYWNEALLFASILSCSFSFTEAQLSLPREISARCVSLLHFRNRGPQTGWLKQYKFIFTLFSKLEVWDQNVDSF